MRYIPFALFCLLFSLDAAAGGAAAMIVPALVTAFAGAAATSIFTKKPKAPGLPKEKTAPTPDDASARRNAERNQQRRYAGQGRAGTILSENNTLG